MKASKPIQVDSRDWAYTCQVYDEDKQTTCNVVVHPPENYTKYYPMDPPIPASGPFPPITGVTHSVCAKHAD